MNKTTTFAGFTVLALVAVASVQAHRQSLLETELADADVTTKAGKKIPISQVRHCEELHARCPLGLQSAAVFN